MCVGHQHRANGRAVWKGYARWASTTAQRAGTLRPGSPGHNWVPHVPAGWTWPCTRDVGKPAHVRVRVNSVHRACVLLALTLGRAMRFAPVMASRPVRVPPCSTLGYSRLAEGGGRKGRGGKKRVSGGRRWRIAYGHSQTKGLESVAKGCRTYVF